MDTPLTVLLVEDEPTECEAIIQYVKSIKGNVIHLVGVIDSADEALECTKKYSPDAIILDLEFHKGSGNGISFLEELEKEIVPLFYPYILITTWNDHYITLNRLRSLGVGFIMLKEERDYSAKKVVEFLLSMKESIHSSRGEFTNLVNKTQNEIHTKIAMAMDLLEIKPKAIGRKYLIDAISLLIDGRENYIPIIAQKYNKTIPSVERAMQYVIDHTWRYNDIDDLRKYYTAKVNLKRGVPTTTEFVYHYAYTLMPRRNSPISWVCARNRVNGTISNNVLKV